jgi:multidrug efflux system outer membrane protein
MRPTSRRVVVASLSALIALGIAGCINLAPTYRQPAAPLPSSWLERGAAASSLSPSPTTYELGWQDFIRDERLRRVVTLALRQNRDLRVATLNIEKARAAYRIENASLFPNLSGGASESRTRAVGITSTEYSASLNVNYEIDLFGRIRNLSDAALASYFSTIENQHAAQVLLISEVVTAWLTMAADEQRLVLSRQTLASQQASLDLTIKIRDLGATTGLAVAQVRSTVEAARVQVGSLKTAIALDRNVLELLVGAPLVDADAPGADLPIDASLLFDVQRDLSSTVLTRRPDVQASERSLQATYDDIGAARAAFFPRVTLTSSAGTASTDLRGLFKNGSGSWTFGPSITLPIFDGGFNRANLANAVADRDIAIANYERTLQTAFREVADVLAAKATLNERTAGQEALVDALATSFRLSEAIFRQGGSNYLAVLTAQQGLYGAQQSLISLRLEEQTTRIALYKALGGGWNEKDQAP